MMEPVDTVARNKTEDRGIRNLRLALGLIWLLDGALQFQPYMFTRSFVDDVILPTAQGNAGFVTHPTLSLAHLITPDIAVWNALFATLQVALGVGIVAGTLTKRAPVLKVVLAGSIAWSVLVWWFSEGLGGILQGGSPIAGAPGAVILYAVAAVLLWPGTSDDGDTLSAPFLGGTFASGAWLGLWVFSGFLLLEPANQGRGAISSLVSQAADGEPGIVHRPLVDVAHALAGGGPWEATIIAVAMVVIGAGAVLGRHPRPFLISAIVLAGAIWIFGEAFGGILTGQGTDPNSGPLWVLLAMCMWVGLGNRAELLARRSDARITEHQLATAR
jgi:hypothetical protein